MNITTVVFCNNNKMEFEFLFDTKQHLLIFIYFYRSLAWPRYVW